MTRKQRKQHQAEVEKARKLLAVTLVVTGAFIGLVLDHWLGFAVEAAALYLVELV